MFRITSNSSGFSLRRRLYLRGPSFELNRTKTLEYFIICQSNGIATGIHLPRVDDLIQYLHHCVRLNAE